GVVLHRALRAGLVSSVDIHRAEFEHPDHAVVVTEALLHKKHGPDAVYLDQECYDGHQGAEADKQKRGHYSVFDPLDHGAPMLKGAIGDLEHRDVADVADAAHLKSLGDRFDAET